MSVNDQPEQDRAIACDLSAIPTEQRGQHFATVAELFGAALEIRELADGIALRLPPETPMLYKAVEFIARERLCCPFYNFALEIEPYGGAFWLRLTGCEGVKELLMSGVDSADNRLALAAAGLNPERMSRDSVDGLLNFPPIRAGQA
jgi:hypothetical protein